MTRRIVVIVADILSLKGTTLFTVNPDMMLSDAVLTMDEHDIGSVAVMENGKLVGMLTFREVVRMLARRQLEHRSGPTRPVAEIRVSDVMVSDPVVVTPSTEVNELRRVMVESHARYVPVMDDGVLLGILSFHDVARSVLEAQSFENRMLKAYIRDCRRTRTTPTVAGSEARHGARASGTTGGRGACARRAARHGARMRRCRGVSRSRRPGIDRMIRCGY